MDEKVQEDLATEESMFVQTAASSTLIDDRLALVGAAASTLYFSDRPERVTGHMETSDFVDLWGAGENSFEEDPPNAVLSFLRADADVPSEAVVVLRDPRLEDAVLSYGYELLDGSLDGIGGPVSLFIDPFGRPLSPVSVCGVRRRGRRRGRRRAMRRGF